MSGVAPNLEAHRSKLLPVINVFQVAEQHGLVAGLEPHRQGFLAGKGGEAVELPDKSDRLHLIEATGSSASDLLRGRNATTAAPLGRGRRESCSRVDKAASRVQFALRCQ